MKQILVLSGVCLAAVVLVAGAAQAQDVPAGDAARGFKAYKHHLCDTCHGSVGQGGERGAGPKISPDVWPYAAFAHQTRKPRLVMIPYSEKTLPEKDLIDIHAYLRTIKRPPAAKDVPLLKDF